MLQDELGDAFCLVTPGIRLEGAQAGQHDDQKRIMTPQQAIAVGADYLVIGRPLTQSSQPLNTLKAIYHSLEIAER